MALDGSFERLYPAPCGTRHICEVSLEICATPSDSCGETSFSKKICYKRGCLATEREHQVFIYTKQENQERYKNEKRAKR